MGGARVPRDRQSTFEPQIIKKHQRDIYQVQINEICNVLFEISLVETSEACADL